MIEIVETASFSYEKNSKRTNQDSILSPFYITNDGILFAVADGVGSYQGGDLASKTAIDYLKNIKEKEQITHNIKSIFSKIRENILSLGNINADYKQAATTLTFGFLDENNLYIGHIGDCRLYFKDSTEKLKQITKDHTELQQLVDEKIYTKKFLQNKKIKHILTTAIANNVEMKIDTFQISLSEIQDLNGYISIYLMSDGTHHFWDKRPRFSNNTMKSVSRFASSIKKRIEVFSPVDDYSLVALTVKRI